MESKLRLTWLLVFAIPGSLFGCGSDAGPASKGDPISVDTESVAAANLGAAAASRSTATGQALRPGSRTFPPTSQVKALERMPNGLIRVTRGTEIGYLRAVCDRTDSKQPHCTSYVGTNADGVIVPADAPGSSCSGGTGVCLGAPDLATAYAIPTSATAGETIAIIGFADSPNFESDLATYRSTYGLPACTSASGCFKKVNQNGTSSPLAGTGGSWESEQTLDMQMASAGCPSCNIIDRKSVV